MKTLSLLASLLVLSVGRAQDAADAVPNVVLIVADDQGWADLGCVGLAADVKTPNLDRLAARGVRFTQAYATSPVCSPSRAGLITGCYQQRFGTFWYGGKGMHDARFVTIPEILRRDGCVTGYVGKFHASRGGGLSTAGPRSDRWCCRALRTAACWFGCGCSDWQGSAGSAPRRYGCHLCLARTFKGCSAACQISLMG